VVGFGWPNGRVIAGGGGGPAGYTEPVDAGAADPGVARAGTAVAARRQELGISQRELARRRTITAPALIAFEKGRAWPRERTRHTLEELLQWPAGTIAGIRAGAPPPQAAPGPSARDGSEVALVADAVELALARFDDAIGALPSPTSTGFAARAGVILADLHKLERLAARAVRHSGASPAVIKALGAVRRRYDELMVQVAGSPGATLGQRLYAARRRVNVTAAETAAALGAPAELIEGLEAGNAVDGSTVARVEALIEQWTV
jgi:transcriptional regulator with XRE-family HTH domain